MPILFRNYASQKSMKHFLNVDRKKVSVIDFNIILYPVIIPLKIKVK